MSTRRSTRRRAKKVQPNPSFYVGYVEDCETTEMIMKKFEMLEKLKEQKRAQKTNIPEITNDSSTSTTNSKKKTGKEEMSDDEDNIDKKEEDNDQLNDEELIKLFEKTSQFSMQSVKNNNEYLANVSGRALYDNTGLLYGYDSDNDDYFKDMFSTNADYDVQDDENAYSDNEYQQEEEHPRGRGRRNGNKGTRVRGDKSGGKGGSKKRIFRRAVQNNEFDFGFDLNNAFKYNEDAMIARGPISSKIKECKDEIYLKIPDYPMNPTWCYMIEPIPTKIEKELKHEDILCHKYLEKDVTKLTLDDFGGNKFGAILIDLPYETKYEISQGNFQLDQLKEIPFETFMDVGMVFIWVPGEYTIEITDILEKKGFTYAEHACWIKKSLNNKILCQKGKYFSNSKFNLLLFRKGTNIDLRHQRTSDCWFNNVIYNKKNNREIKPNLYMYNLIEVLLAECIDKNAIKNNKPTMLFIGSQKNEKRKLWHMVYDTVERLPRKQKLDDENNHTPDLFSYYDDISDEDDTDFECESNDEEVEVVETTLSFLKDTETITDTENKKTTVVNDVSTDSSTGNSILDNDDDDDDIEMM